MAIVNGLDLSQFSAAGVYTIYQDETVQAALSDSPVVSLVPGFSTIGRFNTGILIQRGDLKTADALYGPISRTLERKGSFFHRTLRVCLQSGPVIALNLLNLDNTVLNGVPTAAADISPYRSFSIDTSEANGVVTTKLYASYFNKERFWFPDRDYLIATRDALDDGKLLNVVNISQSPYTILARKSEVSGFDISVKEWYEGEEIPSYLKPDDFVSDYFVDLIVINGNFGSSNYERLSVDPIFGPYFDQQGLIISRLDDFLALPEVVVRDVLSGTIIPAFRDKQGVSHYIQDIVNRKVNTLGLLLAVDTDELDKFEFGTNTSSIDMVGHNLIDGSVSIVDFLSYNRKITQDFNYEGKTSNTIIAAIDTTDNTTITPGVTKITVQILAASANFAAVEASIALNDYVPGTTTAEGTAAGITVANPVLKVSKLTIVAGISVTFELTSPLKEAEVANSGSFVDITLATDDMTLETEVDRILIDGTTTFYLADINSQVYDDWRTGKLTDGDKAVGPAGLIHYLKFEQVFAEGGLDATDDYRELLMVSSFTDTDLQTPIANGDAHELTEFLDSNGYAVGTTQFNFVSLVGSINERVTGVSTSDNTFEITTATDGSKFTRDDYLVGFDEDNNEILTRILTLVNVSTETVITTTNKIKVFTAPDGTNQVERFKPVISFFTHFDLTYLSGFTLKDTHTPNKTNARMKEIYGVIDNTNIRKALVDPDFVGFRYLVDTFNHGLEGNSKAYLSRLVRDRQKCIGLLNAPSIQEFLNSADPRFTTTPTDADPIPLLDTKYIKDGANLAENPSTIYTLPNEGDGASFVGYFSPNMIIEDSDGNEVSFPLSAVANNAYVNRFTSGQQFLPPAGVRRGGVSGLDGIKRLEYAFDLNDRKNLAAKGINPVIFKNNQFMIYDDLSAYQQVQSTLSRLSARDTLVTFEIDTENILGNYVFEYNDANIRNEVRNLLDAYYGGIQRNFGAIQSYELIFNDTNNTDAVTRENIGIVDVKLNLPDIIRAFVNRVTLFRNQSPSSGGFIAV